MPSEFELLVESGENFIGFYGHPPKKTLDEWREKLGLKLLDLDIYLGAPEAGILPKSFCRIIANIVNNSIALKRQLKAVVAATGMEKCDSGRYAAKLLEELGIPNVIYTTNEKHTSTNEIILCEAKERLKKRVVRIMQTVYNPLSEEDKSRGRALKTKARIGFWGTPPHPIELLDLFPDDTHIFGWTRCVEAGRPSDLELECFAPDDIPIIFFAQSFCNKAQLAQFLAKKHNGMFVDSHCELHKSLAARIEAFIRING